MFSSLDVLRDEADELEVSHKEPVRLILTKIQRLCNTPTIKHTTIFTGQVNIYICTVSLFSIPNIGYKNITLGRNNSVRFSQYGRKIAPPK